MTDPLDLDCDIVFEERGVGVSLHVKAGETVALLGPNGAGKSSVISAIAGTLRPDRGRAVLGERTLFDLDEHGRGVWQPPYARDIALLAQEPLLFPHLTVLENVAFGPRSSGRSRRVAHEVARRWLDEVGALPYARRKPAQLSGGQAQRIAVARALAADPRLLLLDEPMAALDVTMVPAVRQMLRRVLAGRTAVIVTHDVLDALLLADRVLVIEEGRVAETGSTVDVLTRPRSAFGASIADVNLLQGTATADGVRLADGCEIHGVAHIEAVTGEPAIATFAPRSVALYPEPPGGSPRNVWPATVRELEPRGSTVRVHVTGPAGMRLGSEVTATAVAELRLVPGAEVYAVVKASEVTTYPA
ncbi:sulfate/molybdate ABC transporter ATP-binding protein [uncultured Aeromicrobium sp.]|uniref:sulfate/molybdate ABC transporter ATP-binding protein n=1 Tax=uncultured Aeromicrobium sp. TaxID=337820 RepID=UPI0025F936AF|nr:ATP-binding cassette domain-containing protein [uncultured Aeromicrobium sp.]